MKRSHKKLPGVEVVSYGKYTGWNERSRELPELLELTHEVHAEIDVEFGLIIEIRNGKGRYIDYIIHHPPFKDKYGNITPSFEGEYHIRTNPYRFFLGDTVWEPIEDKKGNWEFIILIDQQIVVRKKIILI